MGTQFPTTGKTSRKCKQKISRKTNVSSTKVTSTYEFQKRQRASEIPKSCLAQQMHLRPQHQSQFGNSEVGQIFATVDVLGLCVGSASSSFRGRSPNFLTTTQHHVIKVWSASILNICQMIYSSVHYYFQSVLTLLLYSWLQSISEPKAQWNAQETNVYLLFLFSRVSEAGDGNISAHNILTQAATVLTQANLLTAGPPRLQNVARLNGCLVRNFPPLSTDLY